MKVGEAFTGQYLKAANLAGKRINLTIHRVTAEKVGDGTKPVLYFVGREDGPGLVLNRTNANMIAEICQDDEMDNWKGAKIVLFPSKTDYQGQRVDCIRVDYPKGQPKPEPELDSEFPDDPPF